MRASSRLTYARRVSYSLKPRRNSPTTLNRNDGGAAAPSSLKGTMTDTQSPTLARSLCASSTPSAMRPLAATSSFLPTSAGTSTGHVPAGRARSSTEPATSARRRSSAPWLRSMPFRFAPTLPTITSPAENRNFAWRTTPGRPRSLRWISSASGLSTSTLPYGITIRCAFSARTFSWNSRWKPLVTASTTISDWTPSTTPIVDTVVNTENRRNSRNSMNIRPAFSTSRTPTVSSARVRPRAAKNKARPPTPTAAVAASATRSRRARCGSALRCR